MLCAETIINALLFLSLYPSSASSRGNCPIAVPMRVAYYYLLFANLIAYIPEKILEATDFENNTSFDAFKASSFRYRSCLNVKTF